MTLVSPSGVGAAGEDNSKNRWCAAVVLEQSIVMRANRHELSVMSLQFSPAGRPD
jgi:hypothetical protein